MKSLLKFSVASLMVFSMIIAGCVGDPGPTGDQGIPGLDGSMFYFGTTAPPASLGNDGDMYLDKVSATIYGPKLAGD